MERPVDRGDFLEDMGGTARRNAARGQADAERHGLERTAREAGEETFLRPALNCSDESEGTEEHHKRSRCAHPFATLRRSADRRHLYFCHSSPVLPPFGLGF